MAESESIHVPAHAVRRFHTFVKFAWPIAAGLATILGSWWTYGSVWVKTRTSLDAVRIELAPDIGKIATAAAAAQSDVHHAANDAAQAKAIALELVLTELELWGQAEVERAYRDSPRRSEYIHRARSFYVAAFKERMAVDPSNPADALARARLRTWRPDRD